MLFEESVAGMTVVELYTVGPARVERVEQRTEKFAGPRSYGVVIYRAKSLAYPIAGKDGSFAEHPEAVTTRILKVRANSDGGCEEPANAGRLLGHFWEDGSRYWCFLEKDAEKASRPAPAARPKQAAAPAAHPKAPAPGAGAPGKPSARPAAPPDEKRGSTSEPWRQ